MPDVLFHIPTRIVFGLDAVNRIGQLVADYGERAFLVTEAILYEGKVINRIQDILDKKGVQHIVFDEVVPNATSRTVDDGVTLARGAHADVVIGLGGVRTLSIAKCIAMTAPSAHDMDDYLSGVLPQGEPLPYIEVPTTCRNPFMFVDEYLMIDGRDRTGRVGRTQKGITKAVLIDSKLSLTLPAKYTATTIMDTLLGCIEGFLSSRVNFLSDTYLARAIEILGALVKEGIQNVDDRSHADERQQRGAASGARAGNVQARDRVRALATPSIPDSWSPSHGCPPSSFRTSWSLPSTCAGTGSGRSESSLGRTWATPPPSRPPPAPSRRCGASSPPWACRRVFGSST